MLLAERVQRDLLALLALLTMLLAERMQRVA
jgi:hypothetical protein